jgi:hypothetical protein
MNPRLYQAGVYSDLSLQFTILYHGDHHFWHRFVPAIVFDGVVPFFTVSCALIFQFYRTHVGFHGDNEHKIISIVVVKRNIISARDLWRMWFPSRRYS